MPTPQNDDPSVVADAHTQSLAILPVNERVAEFQRRFAYAMANFSFWRRALGHDASFNASLAELKRAVRRSGTPVLPKLHAELTAAVTYLAWKHAVLNGRSEPLSAGDLEAGAREAARVLKPRRGRPASRVVRHHVEGLMALFEETVGSPALAMREKNSVYDPQAANWSGRYIVDQLRKADPSVTEGMVARMILDARKRYARKPMRFADFFEGYGMKFVPR